MTSLIICDLKSWFGYFLRRLLCCGSFVRSLVCVAVLCDWAVVGSLCAVLSCHNFEMAMLCAAAWHSMASALAHKVLCAFFVPTSFWISNHFNSCRDEFTVEIQSHAKKYNEHRPNYHELLWSEWCLLLRVKVAQSCWRFGSEAAAARAHAW